VIDVEGKVENAPKLETLEKFSKKKILSLTPPHETCQRTPMPSTTASRSCSLATGFDCTPIFVLFSFSV